MGSSNASKSSHPVPVHTVVRDDLMTSSGWGEGPARYLPGEVIDDRYRLEREIGRGGMGVVWVARSLVLGVDVAIKLIQTTETGSESASRMAREANAAARVGHPALVRVFDFGWTRHGDPFLVMELIRGNALSDMIRRDGPQPAIRAVQLLLPIADGLRLAHERTIVHRDIKPGNIIVATEDFGRPQPKLLDFGIAKVGHGGDGKLTQEGVVLGSPEYMSPEQALGLEDIDARTDIWSFGVALYELIVGEVPFRRPNYNALMQAIIHTEPVPMTNQGGADEALWAIVARALTKDRRRRWSTMSEFGMALALWLYDHGVKEDVSGNSVRAVWLSEGLQEGERANTSTVPPDLRASLGATGPRRVATRPAARPLAASRRPWVAIGGAVAAFLAITSIVWILRSPTTEAESKPALEAPAAPRVRAREPKVAPVDPSDVRPTGPVHEVDDLELAGPEPTEKETRKATNQKSPSPPRGVRKVPKADRDFGF